MDLAKVGDKVAISFELMSRLEIIHFIYRHVVEQSQRKFQAVVGLF